MRDVEIAIADERAVLREIGYKQRHSAAKPLYQRLSKKPANLAEAQSLLLEAMGALSKQQEKIDRLKLALDKVEKRFPCSTIADMRRVAAEALGRPAPLHGND